MRRCRSCGEESPPQARFCAFCGSRFDAIGPRVREARRTVTILFCDVVGSTELGERTDPETVRRVLTKVFDMARTVIELHGGVVEKFIGDAVMAVFGLPVSHEDDALRAVRVADGIIKGLETLNHDFERQWGVSIQLRTGIDTGEVATGDPAADEIFATGDAVNVAARFEQAAEPMTIVIGERTRTLTEGSVETERMEPLLLKGKSGPVPAFRVTAIPERSTRPVAAPIAGRERERGVLDATFEDALARERCSILTIIGDAGVGKTRLATEFVSGLPAGTSVMHGRCLSYGDGSSFGPFAHAIRGFLGLDGADQEVALSRIASAVDGAPDAPAVTRAIADVTGVRESAVPDPQVRWAARRLVEHVSSQAPLLLLLDDLQWAHPPLLELLMELEDRARTRGLLILCTARPELLETRPTWATPGAGVLTLDPLPASACRSVVACLLGDDRISDEVLRHVSEVTSGNPLFIEEVVAMLVRDGVIENGTDGWTVHTGLDALPVPTSIQSVLDARLDGLDPAERDALERASVIGEVFYRAALEALVLPEQREHLQETLRGLAQKGLIEPTVSDLAGEEAFRFHHILLRDVAELRLRRSDSAYLHERVADWLDGRRPTSPELAEIIGYHLEEAHRQLSGLGPVDERGAALGRRGAAFLSEAALHAWTRGQDDTAGTLYERAARLLPAGSAQEARTLLEASKAYSAVDSGSAQRTADQARGIADAAGLEAMRLFAEAMFLDSKGTARPTDGDMAASLAAAKRAGAALAEAHDPSGECWAHLISGMSAESLGHAGVAMDFAERAAVIATEHHMPREFATATAFAVGHYIPGSRTVADVIRRGERGLAEAEGDLVMEAMVSAQLGAHLARAGRLTEAFSRSERAMKLADELGSAPLMDMLLQSRAAVEIYAGNWEAAERCERLMAGSVERTGLEGCMSNPIAELSAILFEAGRHDEALEAARSARSLTETDDIYPVTVARCTEALVASHGGDTTGALRMLDEAASRLAPLDMPELVADVERARGRVLLRAGRRDEAREAFESAVETYERIGVLASAQRTRAMIGELARRVTAPQIPSAPRGAPDTADPS